MQADGERPRDDLQVETPAVPPAHLVEHEAVVGDDPGEDVQPAGRALRVGLGADVGREIQLLD
jgi:hypothetical protein